jgi:hypothetical protein
VCFFLLGGLFLGNDLLEIEQLLDESNIGHDIRSLSLQKLQSPLVGESAKAHQVGQHNSGRPTHPHVAMHQNAVQFKIPKSNQ